jgi:hypothetical protein
MAIVLIILILQTGSIFIALCGLCGAASFLVFLACV